jgi:hypothetical protein
MGFLGGMVGYRVLRLVGNQGQSARMDGSAYLTHGKLQTLLGREFWQEVKGKAVVDFGCGTGAEA